MEGVIIGKKDGNAYPPILAGNVRLAWHSAKFWLNARQTLEISPLKGLCFITCAGGPTSLGKYVARACTVDVAPRVCTML